MNDMDASEKLARVLRADKDYLMKIGAHLSEVTGKKDVLEGVLSRNNGAVHDRLSRLGVRMDASAKEVYDALISRIEADNHAVSEAFKTPALHSVADCARVLEVVKRVAGTNHGFFLKEEKAREFLKNEPPRKVMEYLGYDSVDAMLEKEDLYEVYSALRFVEGSEWLNAVFFNQYKTLTPEDFEERAIQARALPERWNRVAKIFVKKKWHNISHLKEMGVVFVIPITLGISGELLRMIALVFHYLHEIPFYSDMFRKVAGVPETFAESVISLLRGDVIERRIPEGEKTLWLVVQRYLAKDDENEWRLFVPHLNPEAIHWRKAAEDIVRLGSELGEQKIDLSFWEGLDSVGDYFKDEIGNDVLVSFNIVDTVMSLVKEKELIKYLYHHEEALWNDIFAAYFSHEELENFSKEYLLQGYFEV